MIPQNLMKMIFNDASMIVQSPAPVTQVILTIRALKYRAD